MPANKSFIEFVEIPAPGVTKRWYIRAINAGACIGRISWSTAWRKYVLGPAYPTDWDEACLREVADFLETQTREHKDAAKARNG